MKILIAFLIVISVAHAGNAQSTQFGRGQTDLNAGIGFVSVLGSELQDNNNGIGTHTQLPPISITLDFAVNNHISIGGYLGIAKDHLLLTGYNNMEIGTMTHRIVGIRGLYHFDVSNKFDTYGGIMLGYNAVKLDVTTTTAKQIAIRGFTYNVLIGGRYHFTKYVGVFSELGYGVSVFNIGLSLKLSSLNTSKGK